MAIVPSYVAERNLTVRCHAAWESARDSLEEPTDDYPADQATTERRMQDDLRRRRGHRGAAAVLRLLRSRDALPSSLRHTVLPLAEFGVHAYPEAAALDAIGNDRPPIDTSDPSAIRRPGRRPPGIVRKAFRDLSQAVVEDGARVQEPPEAATERLMRDLRSVAARMSLAGERLYVTARARAGMTGA